MVNYEVILQAVLPVYLLVLLGFFLRAIGVLAEELERGLLKLVIHCLYPCLILDKTLGNELVLEGAVLAWGVGLGFGLVMVGMGMSFLMAKLLRLQSGNGLRTFCVGVGVQNFGYIAVPMLAALYVVGGDDGVLGVLFLHSLGVEVALWMVGVMVITGSIRGNAKLLLNGPVVAVVLGVTLSLTGGWRFFDSSGGGVLGGSLRQMMSWLGDCAFPMGLLLIGATIFEFLGKERLSGKVAVGALVVRLGVMPLVFLAAAKWLPIILELRQVLVVQAAMPVAVSPIFVARHYGGSPGIVVQAVLVTSVAALVTIPLWIFWGNEFIFGP